MNMQALMKQAQTMQRDMQKAQQEISETEFEYENEMVKVVVFGTKEVKEVIIKIDIENDDKEILEDMILLAMNNAFNDVDKFTEEIFQDYFNVS